MNRTDRTLGTALLSQRLQTIDRVIDLSIHLPLIAIKPVGLLNSLSRNFRKPVASLILN